MKFKQDQTRLTSIYKSQSLEIGSEILFFFTYAIYSIIQGNRSFW